MDTLWQDLRFGLRTLRKDRGYTFAAIAALALGIGVNVALFTLFNGVVLQSLPVPEPNKVVAIYRTTPQLPFLGLFSYPDYVYYRDHNTSFAGVSAMSPAHLRMSGAPPSAESQATGLSNFAGISGPEQLLGASEPVNGLFVSANYFSVMSVNPVFGRSLLPGDDQGTGSPYAVLLSENYWQRRFGGDPNILGKHLLLSGISATVVGITPRDFMGERPVVPDVWLPLAAQQSPQRRLQDRTSLCCQLEARLKPGITLQQSEAEVALLTNAIKQENPETEQRAIVSVKPAVPFGFQAHSVFQVLYLVIQMAMGLVLLIACANVAGLLMGRAAARQKEIAVRLALGASRRRLVRQLLTEGVLIAQLAGGLSVLLTWWMLDTSVKALSSSLINSGLSDGGTLLFNVTPDARVFLYTCGIALLTGIIFALLPALQATKPNLTSALKAEGALFGSGGRSRFRGWMVATQIAVCLMLLISAGVLVRSSVRLLSVDPGFETSQVLNVSILNPEELGYPASRVEELQRVLRERLRALPGVKSLAVTSDVPLGGNVRSTLVVPQGSEVTGDPRASGQAPQYPYSFVSPEYFETLSIPLLRGRSFTSQEIATQAPVAIISQALAQRLWPGEDAIGRRVTIGSPAQTHFPGQQVIYSESSEVIGIARDIHGVSIIAPDAGALYLPKPPGRWDQHLLVRVEGDPRRVMAALASEVQAVDRNLSVSLQTLDQMLTSDAYFVATRLGSILSAAIGLLGLILASVGIYSMVGYTVSQQTREIGIRLALGAQPRDVLKLVVGQAALLAVIGVGIGLAAALALTRLMSRLLFDVSATDPATFAAIALLLTAVALLASYIPARRAMKVDPMVALRYE